MIRNKFKFFKQKTSFKNAFAFLSGALSLISLAWIGDLIFFCFYKPDEFILSALLYAIAAFCTCSLLTAVLAFNYIHIRDLSSTNDLPKAKVLIMAVSPISSGYQIRESGGVFTLYQRPIDGQQEHWIEKAQFSGSLQKDITMLDTYRLNWQQTLRALKANIGELEQIVLVPSEQLRERMYDEERQIDIYKRWLAQYGKDPYAPETNFKVTIHKEAVNKDNMRQYYGAFAHEIDLARLQCHDEKKIRIDITGGQVPASIGGSLATLHNNCAMQYVNNDKVVNNYRAEIKQVRA
ncbi:hypothetical protein J8Z24_09575 [Pseudoalteromonas sp. SCSIO 43201]|uniref:hypothetical protein n=1 Tax=Pseudoalteromonas sp. SCSIO 43201 TaxID=2822842 RepID=UPI0020762D11|nr:hypothetical protein [Pseudoalteromonas sp. SCSIO 43201]USD27236.1 hypothetical protein J8Z24_09575 [Pseudoalteromonas sp. SCSIO 43201]